VPKIRADRNERLHRRAEETIFLNGWGRLNQKPLSSGEKRGARNSTSIEEVQRDAHLGWEGTHTRGKGTQLFSRENLPSVHLKKRSVECSKGGQGMEGNLLAPALLKGAPPGVRRKDATAVAPTRVPTACGGSKVRLYSGEGGGHRLERKACWRRQLSHQGGAQGKGSRKKKGAYLARGKEASC